MYEYHGWMNLKVSSGDLDNEEELLSQFYSQVQRKIILFEQRNRFANLMVMNGEYFLHIAGSNNHSSQVEDELIDLITFINEYSSGTYGLVYIRDDENSDGLSNDFQVLRISRGKLERMKDIFLSPCIPTIEDP
jgi:Immunity protein 7